jgi:hypothetical protein
MNLRQALDKMKFDVRMVDLNVRNGSIKQQDVQKHLESLEDAQTNATNLEIDENEGVRPEGQ